MKLNLLLNNPAGMLSGHVNVDPFAIDGDGGDGRVRCDLHDLSPLADPNEVEAIIAHDLLDHYPSGQADAVLDHWLSRLAHGGTLTVSVVDLREVARGFLGGALGIDDANTLLHGEQDGPGRSRACSLTLSLLVEVLANRGLHILSKRVSNYRAVVTCRRP